jgi:hypothetical protein
MYYPKSQIKTNLFTNGGEYYVSLTKEEYKGYYYETSNGQFFTGKSPQQNPSLLLIPFTSLNPLNTSLDTSLSLEIEQVNDIVSPILPNRNIPQFNPTLPTTQDQQNGQFNRYFCKRTNENRYMEIDFNTYTQLRAQDPKIAWDLYNPTQIIWLIQGNREQVYNSNKGSVQSIEQNLKWYGFTQYFKEDFSKYYLGS